MIRLAISERLPSDRTGNILHNGNFESRPVLIAPTNTPGWITGQATGAQSGRGYGWAIISTLSGAEAAFDATVSKTGTGSMRLSTLNTSGAITVGSYRTNPPAIASLFELQKVAPNTLYTIRGDILTNNVANNGAFLEFREFNASGGTVLSTVSNKLSGTDTWRTAALTIMTGANTRFGGIFLRNNVPGNISTAWFDNVYLIGPSGRVPATGRTLI